MTVVPMNPVPADVWDRQQVELVKRTIAREATDDELELFIGVCKRTGLDPFARQIYFMRTTQGLSVVTSIDGLRLVAQRSGDYAGQTIPRWCAPDGTWTEVWLGREQPRAARVGVYRKGFVEALTRVAHWDESAQRGRNGDLTPMWKKMPAHMLSIRAETHALRASFPQELSGLYTADEMGDTDSPPPAPPPAPSIPETLAPDRVKKFLEFCASQGVTKGEDIEEVVRAATEGRTSDPTEVRVNEVQRLQAAVRDIARPAPEPEQTTMLDEARRATAMRRLFATMADAGITDDDRHTWASEVLEREVPSFADLSEDELNTLWQDARDKAGPDEEPDAG